MMTKSFLSTDPSHSNPSDEMKLKNPMMKNTHQTLFVSAPGLHFQAPWLATVAAILLSAQLASAATSDYFWNPNGVSSPAAGGTGSWDTSASLWRNNTNTGAQQAWVNGSNNANFAGTAGTVTLGTGISANTLIFGAASGTYVIDGAGSILTITGARAINTGATTAIIHADIAGTGFFKGTDNGSGVLVLTGANTFGSTSGVNINGGTVRVGEIGGQSNTGGNLGGAYSTVKLGSPGVVGVLEYTGAGETTDRVIDLAGTSNGHGRLENSGYGTLSISSNLTATGAGSKQLILGGGGKIAVSGNIVNNSGSNATSVLSVGGGTFTLSGANTFTGGLNVQRGANLVLDYANNATVVDSTNAVILGNGSGGTLTIKGKSTGTTAQTLGNLAFSTGQNTVVVDRNGGSGTSLALGTLTRSTAGSLLFDLSSGGTLTANLPVSSPINLVDGVLVAGSGSTSSLGVVVRTGTNTYDFATGSSAAAGVTISALGAITDLVASGGFTTTNYKVSGDKTITSTTTSSTIRVDTTAANNNTLTIQSGQTLTFGKNTILFDGTSNFNIAGPGKFAGTNATFIQQWSTGTVTIGSDSGGVGTTQRIDKYGTGLLVNNSAISTSGGLNIYGGVYRAGSSASLTTGNISMGTGGVLELTAGSGDFVRALGTGSTNVQFLSDGGFSASGGDRVVAFNGTGSPTALTWGSTTNFLASGNKLTLSGSTS
ncbi:MAG: hypothetical protein ABI600_08725, partial [Luteolibacter sp.]